MARGLVLSGSSARLLAQAGACKLLGEKGWRADVCTGTSGGAICASFYAAGRLAALERLALELRAEDLWGDDGPGAIATVTRISRLLRAAGALDPAGLRRLLARELRDEALLELRAPGAVELHVPAFDVHAGREAWWTPASPPDELRSAILGSAALPLALPPVRIGSSLLADAGVVVNHPVARACTRLLAHDGDRELIVVSALQPPARGPLGDGLPGLLDLAGRLVAAALERFSRFDFEDAEALNVPQTWIHVRGLEISLEDFVPEDAQRAHRAGYEAARAAWDQRRTIGATVVL